MATIRIEGPEPPAAERVLTPGALEFVAELQRRFGGVREELLLQRARRVEGFASGTAPDFLAATRSIRDAGWRVAPAPEDLADRRVEIIRPAERRAISEALASGVTGVVADFEDTLSPTWANVVAGQADLIDAVRREVRSPHPMLSVRPRGWHLVERHLRVDDEPVAAGLFDFGLYLFHNAGELRRRGTGPYFDLPKLESHLEARLWNTVFVGAQELLAIPRGTIRATALIETLTAAFEMDEILWELREHATALRFGPWDYLVSVLRHFPSTGPVFPDRARITPEAPFLRAAAERLVGVCHRRGAHALGGKALYIPDRGNRERNRLAIGGVRQEVAREGARGFDGTSVAHPGLVPVVRAVFDGVLGGRKSQLDVLRADVHVSAGELLDIRFPDGAITERGVRESLSVALSYLNAWLQGEGTFAAMSRMEDAATAELCRVQLWQWLRCGVTLEDGRSFDREMYLDLRDQEIDENTGGLEHGRIRQAAEMLDRLVLGRELVPFLTSEAYEYEKELGRPVRASQP